MGPVVAVHGGAGRWSISPEEETHVRRALEGAVDAGLAAVARGNAVDAVVEAVAYMEDSGVFNAGVGSVYTVSGRVQMDAGVMDGASGRAGAVAAVEDVKNPVRLARYVLDATDHVLVVGEGARELARAAGLLTAKTAFYSDRKNEMFKRMRQETLAGRWHYKKVLEVARRLGVSDTVGAVALDRDGNLAAATSTGGVWLKLDGRQFGRGHVDRRRLAEAGREGRRFAYPGRRVLGRQLRGGSVGYGRRRGHNDRHGVSKGCRAHEGRPRRGRRVEEGRGSSHREVRRRHHRPSRPR